MKAESEECVDFYFKKVSGRQTEDTQGELRARAAAAALEFKQHLKIQVSYLWLNVVKESKTEQSFKPQMYSGALEVQ